MQTGIALKGMPLPFQLVVHRQVRSLSLLEPIVQTVQAEEVLE